MYSKARIALQRYLGEEEHQRSSDAGCINRGRHPPLFTAAAAAGVVAACAGAIELIWQSQFRSVAPAPNLRHQDPLLSAFVSCHRARATSRSAADGCPVVLAA